MVWNIGFVKTYVNSLHLACISSKLIFLSDAGF